jgi:hypothetical protein
MATTIRDAAQLVNLPATIIVRLVKDGIIADPIQDEELKGLMMIAHIYGKDWYVRKLMAPMSKVRRVKIASEPDLSRAERYALSLYKNAQPGLRLTTAYIVNTVRHYLGITLTAQQILKVRQFAYNAKRSASKKVAPHEMAYPAAK